jgi:prolyl 4-hydroxylase
MRLSAFLPMLLPLLSLRAASSQNTCSPDTLANATSQVAQVLSWSPRIVLVENFMSLSECAELIEETTHSMKASQAFGEAAEARSSQTKWLPRSSEAKTPIVKTFVDRIHNFAMVPNDHGETLQIVKYGVGDKYEFHHDTDRRMARLATGLVYLNDVEEGGETIFPFVEVSKGDLPLAVDNNDLVNGIADMAPYCASSQYLKIKPKAGSLLLFYSMKPNLNIDDLAWHGSCPVVKGEKYAAQRWIKYMGDPNFEEEIVEG